MFEKLKTWWNGKYNEMTGEELAAATKAALQRAEKDNQAIEKHNQEEGERLAATVKAALQQAQKENQPE